MNLGETNINWSNPPSENPLVYLAVKFKKIFNLSAADGSVEIKIGVQLIWQDERVCINACRLPDGLWCPHVTLDEMIDVQEQDVYHSRYKQHVVKDWMQKEYTLVGKISNAWLREDMKWFPFDLDDIVLTFKADGVTYLQTEIREKTSNRDWRLCYFRVEGRDHLNEEFLTGFNLIGLELNWIENDLEIDIVQYKVIVCRAYSYYLWKIILPIVLLYILNIFNFFIGPENIGERLSNNCTLFLAQFAILFVVQQDMPRLNYLTLLDRLIIVTLLVIIWCPISYVVQKAWKEEDQSYDGNLNMYLCYIVPYLLYVAGEFIIAARHQYQTVQKIQCNFHWDNKISKKKMENYSFQIINNHYSKKNSSIICNSIGWINKNDTQRAIVLSKEKNNQYACLSSMSNSNAKVYAIDLPTWEILQKSLYLKEEETKQDQSMKLVFQNQNLIVRQIHLNGEIRDYTKAVDTEYRFIITSGVIKLKSRVVISYTNFTTEPEQKYILNSDSTISPEGQPELIMGVIEL